MDHPTVPATNPFATRYVRPAVGDYLFPDQVRPEDLIARLRNANWWGQVIGPHGSGKSTLLHRLVPELEAAGRRVVFCTLTRTRRRLPLGHSEIAAWQAETQIVLDGFEQLHWFWRIWLRRTCRRHDAGLLVTAHRSVRLPTLWQTETSPELANRIVARLLGRHGDQEISAQDVQRCFDRHCGDMRETLMALYDLYEMRNARRQGR
jgi:hypothetical protein